MASSKIKGITIEIGGDTTKLGKALESSEKQSRSLQGELKQVEKLLKFDPSNTELLAQKQKLLNGIIAETTSKLKTLEDAQDQVYAQFQNGEIGEDAYRAFQREIIKTQNELKNFEAQLNGTEEAVKDVGDATEGASDGFTIMGGALAGLVSNVIQGAISSIGNLVGSLMELSEATEEYRQMQAKLEGSANTFGYSMDFVGGKYEELYKYLGDDQMVTNAITNLMGLGTSTDNVSSLVEASIGVWSAYGDSIPIEGLTEALNETAQVGKVTGSLADALNWAGISEDAFNEKLEKCSSTQERADLIAKTLNDTYGASKKTYDELSGSITDANEAELALKDTQAQLGEAMAPVNTAMTNLKAQALEAITPLVQTLAQAFLDMLTWLKEHPIAMQVLTAIVIALASAFTVLAGALAIQGIITGVTKAIAFLNTTLLANPIVLITALLAGLVAGFIYLWENCEAFRQFWINLWENIKAVGSTVVNALIKFFTETLPNALKALPGKIWSAIQGAIERVTTWGNNLKERATNAVKSLVSNVFSFASQIPSKIASAISGAISAVSTWGSNMLSRAKSAMTNVVNGIKNTFSNLPSQMATIGKNLVQGIWNGISNATDWVLSKIKGFGKSITNGIKKIFGIASPSKLFRDEVGKYLAEGIAVGIEENADDPITALQNVGDDMLTGIQGINGATLNRQLETTFNASVSAGSIADLVALVSDYMPKLIEASKHALVLDTGVLVGETIGQIDAGLGDLMTYRGRGM